MIDTNLYIFITNLFVVCGACVYAVTLGSSALTSLMCLFIVCANLFINKSIALLGFHITATDALAVGTGLALNILREYFGKEEAQKAINISFFIAIAYAVLSQIHLWYEPTTFDTHHQHYAAILAIMPRLMFASLLAYGISQSIELYLYNKLKLSFHNKFFVMRNYLSLTTSQFVDTLVFSFIGLYGIVESMTNIIIFSYIAKLITVLLSAPLVYMLKQLFISTKK
jgi:uncharacterized integral membrane protein (TIGR00697 family)